MPIFVNFEASVVFTQLTFSDVCMQTDIFETSPHDVALLEKRSAAIPISYKCPLSKMGAKTPKFRKGSAAMLLNHYISAAVRAISTKFGMITQFDPLDRFER